MQIRPDKFQKKIIKKREFHFMKFPFYYLQLFPLREICLEVGGIEYYLKTGQ